MVSLRQVCDTYASIRKGLELIATPEEISSGIMIQLLLTKCDQKTVEEWEKMSVQSNTLPTEEEFSDFLHKRCTQLEAMDYALQMSSKSIPQQMSSNKSTKRQSNASSSSSQNVSCPLCDNSHGLSECDEFLKETPNERYTIVKRCKCCIRCLTPWKGHSRCRLRCEICSGLHNTLVHFISSSDESSTKTSSLSSTNTAQMAVGLSSSVDNHAESLDSLSVQDPSCETYTFLATSIASFKTVDGNYVPLRILLDSGNQVNIISEHARHLLGLPVYSTRYEIQLTGINNSSVTLRKRVVVEMKSLCSNFKDTIVFMVHPRMKQRHPSQPFDVSSWNMPTDIQLADPNFHKTQDVDIVLSSHHVDCLTLAGNISLGSGLPRLRKTKLGWVVLGNVSLMSSPPQSCFTCTAFGNVPSSCHEPSLSCQLQKFWELESIMSPKSFGLDESEIEHHFRTTHVRTTNCRFIVRLPFSRSPEILGHSKMIAEKRLATIVRKCRSDDDYSKQYNEFMEEYISLGHCQEIVRPITDSPHYFIPHFAVTNENSTTTRTRVVFDASCHTDSGISLNEALMVGPKLQEDLVIHLVRFRLKKYVVVGDVSKMYRQILVHPDDRRFQYILWKKPSDKSSSVYELNTVTYGTACAPFLAIRCMQELAIEDGSSLPYGQEVLLNNFYVDDMLAGADTIDEAVSIYEQVTKILKGGQMSIRKFQSNAQEIMQKIPQEDHGTYLNIGGTEVIKTLGLNWIPETDDFRYYYEVSDDAKLTRRSVLSEILRLFDPLGLVQPVVVRAKIFMQRLYASTKNWDEPLSPEDCHLWTQFREELKSTGEIVVPRFVSDLQTYAKEDVKFELHGFCDASQRAYGACLYILTLYPTGDTRSHLLVAKSRVAPLKSVSLPRLELCGSLLLAELYERMSSVIGLEITRTVLWTDSTITLRWISESPHRWKPFVATRVTKIQSATRNCIWKHVDGKMNPADLVSRGLSPSELANSSLWFNGPSFLSNESNWPSCEVLPSDVPDVQKVSSTLAGTEQRDLITQCKIVSFVPLIKHAVWPKLRRIFGYVAKFIRNTRKMVATCENSEDNAAQSVTSSHLEVSDLIQGTLLIIRIVQRECFHDEMKLLKSNHPVSGMFKKLSVFYDPETNTLRVGGRLHNAPGLSFCEKHPFLLPHEHVVTRLIFMWYHNQNLHAGPTALLGMIRSEFWPLNGKVIANRTVHSCIRCSRTKPVTLKQSTARGSCYIVPTFSSLRS